MVNFGIMSNIRKTLAPEKSIFNIVEYYFNNNYKNECLLAVDKTCVLLRLEFI